MLLAFHHAALGTGATVPDWVHLLPSGTFGGRDGRGPYHLRDARAVIAASMADDKLAVDENHAIDLAAATGTPSPARGWIVELQSRPDRIWGRVEWTQFGQQLMADKAYRGISPVFAHDASGNVLRILRASLTNTPNLAQLASLHAELTADEREKMPEDMFAVPAKKELPIRDPEHVRLAWDMVNRTTDLGARERAEARRRILARARQLGIDTRSWHTDAAQAAQSGVVMDLAALRTALSLSDTADEAAILASVTANASAIAAHGSQMSAIATAAGVTVTTPDGIVTALQAQRAAMTDAQRLAATVVTLQTELQTLQAERGRDRAVAFVDGAIAAGKPIAPLRDHYVARHIQDAAAVEKEINALVSINAGGVVRQAVSADGNDPEDDLSDDDKAVIAKMNLDPRKFIETRKQRRAASKKEG